jgi:hypothetical protein
MEWNRRPACVFDNLWTKISYFVCSLFVGSGGWYFLDPDDLASDKTSRPKESSTGRLLKILTLLLDEKGESTESKIQHSQDGKVMESH